MVNQIAPGQSFNTSPNKELGADIETASTLYSRPSKDEETPPPAPNASSSEPKDSKTPYTLRNRLWYHSLFLFFTITTTLAAVFLILMTIRLRNTIRDLGGQYGSLDERCGAVFALILLQWVMLMAYHFGFIGPSARGLGSWSEKLMWSSLLGLFVYALVLGI